MTWNAQKNVTFETIGWSGNGAQLNALIFTILSSTQKYKIVATLTRRHTEQMLKNHDRKMRKHSS
jgi:hypothetical protein